MWYPCCSQSRWATWGDLKKIIIIFLYFNFAQLIALREDFELCSEVGEIWPLLQALEKSFFAGNLNLEFWMRFRLGNWQSHWLLSTSSTPMLLLNFWITIKWNIFPLPLQIYFPSSSKYILPPPTRIYFASSSKYISPPPPNIFRLLLQEYIPPHPPKWKFEFSSIHEMAWKSD